MRTPLHVDPKPYPNLSLFVIKALEHSPEVADHRLGREGGREGGRAVIHTKRITGCGNNKKRRPRNLFCIKAVFVDCAFLEQFKVDLLLATRHLCMA